ncbi:hypothetical protein Plhal304r1_c041g0119241 [Plasmopara halstedii]
MIFVWRPQEDAATPAIPISSFCAGYLHLAEAGRDESVADLSRTQYLGPNKGNKRGRRGSASLSTEPQI